MGHPAKVSHGRGLTNTFGSVGIVIHSSNLNVIKEEIIKIIIPKITLHPTTCFFVSRLKIFIKLFRRARYCPAAELAAG
jgi:hypothetical protein